MELIKCYTPSGMRPAVLIKKFNPHQSPEWDVDDDGKGYICGCIETWDCLIYQDHILWEGAYSKEYGYERHNSITECLIFKADTLLGE